MVHRHSQASSCLERRRLCVYYPGGTLCKLSKDYGEGKSASGQYGPVYLEEFYKKEQ